MMTQMTKYFNIYHLEDIGGIMTEHSKHLIIIFITVLIAGCANTFPDDTFTEHARIYGHPAYSLGPGDKIRVTVYGHDDLSGNFSVDEAGRISLPLIRGINVKGLSLPELESTITKHLLSNYIVNPKVSVDLLVLRQFCILGEVRNPGCYSNVHGLSANNAIAIAGGYTYRALKYKLAITREDGRKVVGNHDTPIFGGDTIEVFERYF